MIENLVRLLEKQPLFDLFMHLQVTRGKLVVIGTTTTTVASLGLLRATRGKHKKHFLGKATDKVATMTRTTTAVLRVLREKLGTHLLGTQLLGTRLLGTQLGTQQHMLGTQLLGTQLGLLQRVLGMKSARLH